MRPRTKRAFALIHLLVLLPLVAVASTYCVRLVDRVLRMQRIAHEEFQNSAAFGSVLHTLRKDAASASAATLAADGSELVITGGDTFESCRYRVQDSMIERITTNDATELASGEWRLRHARLTFSIEDFDDSGQVVWLSLVHEVKLKRRNVHRRTVSAAVRPGEKGRHHAQ